MDMHRMRTITEHGPLILAYSTLVRSTPKGLAGDLLESWKVNGDGTEYTFSLRKGVKWHDGQPLTAEDVKFNFERGSKFSSWWGGFVKPVLKDVQVVDATTLKVTLTSSDAAFLDYLALNQMMIGPKHLMEKVGDGTFKDVVGTGPFKLKSYQPDVSFIGVRNDSYFKQGEPYLDQVIYYVIPDRSTGLAALRARRALMALPVYLSEPQKKVIDRDLPGVTAHLFESGYFWYFAANAKRKPWDDNRVFRAAIMAIDRTEANQVVLQSYGQTYGVVPPELGGFSPADLKKTPGWRDPKSADIEEAKKLLSDAGYPNGLSSRILYRIGPDYENMAVFLRDQEAKVGIKVDIYSLPDTTYVTTTAKKDYDIFAQRAVPSVFDPNTILANYECGNAFNYAQVCDPAVDKLIGQIRGELDVTKRKALVNQVEKLINEKGMGYTFLWGAYMGAWWNDIQNYYPGAAIHNGLRFADVWLKK